MSKYIIEPDFDHNNPEYAHGYRNAKIIKISDSGEKSTIFTYIFKTFFGICKSESREYRENRKIIETKMMTESVTFFLKDCVEHVILNTAEYGNKFPPATLLNLETLETILIRHQMKNKYDKVQISEKNKLIIISGNEMGVTYGSLLYNFDGKLISNLANILENITKSVANKYICNHDCDDNILIIRNSDNVNIFSYKIKKQSDHQHQQHQHITDDTFGNISSGNISSGDVSSGNITGCDILSGDISEDDISDSITFFSYTDTDYAVINNYDIENEYSPAILLNLKTLETINLHHNMKNGYSNLTISEKYKIISFSGHYMGKEYKTVTFDFDGNSLDESHKCVENFCLVPKKFFINQLKGFDFAVVNDEFVLQLTIEDDYFNTKLYPHIKPPPFDITIYNEYLQTVYYKKHIYVGGKFEEHEKVKYILSCYQYPGVYLVNFSDVQKIINFIKECQSYEFAKKLK